MNKEKCMKEAFAVIGKEGSTEDGPGFVQNLWTDANTHFAEVAQLAKKDENGKVGFRVYLPNRTAIVLKKVK